MERLTELFNKHWSDKGTIRDEGHGYGEIYDGLFRKYIGTNPKILEIGIQKGGCVRAISEFFNNECEIYSIDIDNNCKLVENDVPNFKFFNFDASNESMVEKFKNDVCNGFKFDIIIDDGSHIVAEQLKSLAYFNNVLSNDGIYIIEDLHVHNKTWNCGNMHWNGNSIKSTIDCLTQRIPSEQLSDNDNKKWMTNLRDVVIYNRYNYKIRGNSSIIGICRYNS